MLCTFETLNPKVDYQMYSCFPAHTCPLTTSAKLHMSCNVTEAAASISSCYKQKSSQHPDFKYFCKCTVIVQDIGHAKNYKKDTVFLHLNNKLLQKIAFVNWKIWH
jgi:hypothetical protein